MRLSKVGTVKFTFRLKMMTSGRRLAEEGVFTTGLHLHAELLLGHLRRQARHQRATPTSAPAARYSPFLNGVSSSSTSCSRTTAARSCRRNRSIASRRPGMADPVHRARRRRRIAARQLVLALRPRLDRRSAGARWQNRWPDSSKARNGGTAPPASRPNSGRRACRSPTQVERAGDRPLPVIGKHQHDPVGHRRRQQREEPPVEVGPAPFAVAGVLVELEERVPHRFGQLGRRSAISPSAPRARRAARAA